MACSSDSDKELLQEEKKRKKEIMGENEKSEDEKQSHNPVMHDNKKKRKEIFPYGNYKNYYGYRIGQDLDEDPRLKVFRKEWFKDKDCLDIGCNNGIITIQIAKKFLCRRILGIDIDSNRIQDAYWHLRKAVKLQSSGKAPAKLSKLSVEDHANCNSEQSANVSSNEEMKEISRELSSAEERDLFKVVSFQRDNFVKSQHPLEKRYDTILCLSVTKWIHLNWGDDGLLTLFAKIWKLLRPGGILVLEPQPWKSYESNRLVSETTAVNYRNIMFRPEQFQEILLDKIGFRTVEDITSGLSGTKAGFNRPILVFKK